MWWCEDKLNPKTAHFWFSSVAQKRRVLKLPTIIKGGGVGWLGMCFACSFAKNYFDANSKSIVYLTVYYTEKPRETLKN